LSGLWPISTTIKLPFPGGLGILKSQPLSITEKPMGRVGRYSDSITLTTSNQNLKSLSKNSIGKIIFGEPHHDQTTVLYFLGIRFRLQLYGGGIVEGIPSGVIEML
jgi:hypothetical protein